MVQIQQKFSNTPHKILEPMSKLFNETTNENRLLPRWTPEPYRTFYTLLAYLGEWIRQISFKNVKLLAMQTKWKFVNKVSTIFISWINCSSMKCHSFPVLIASGLRIRLRAGDGWRFRLKMLLFFLQLCKRKWLKYKIIRY